MNPKLEPVLQSIDQAAVADELASVMTAVVSDASAPDSALTGIRKARNESVPPEQRAAVAALQAYGAKCIADVLTAGLEQDANERAACLQTGLEEDSASDVLSFLRTSAESASEFKSRLSLRIASRCAEIVAAEIEREKQGHFTILNEQDAVIFESRREAHRSQRAEAAQGFLASLPSRYPSFGAVLFADIRRQVEREVREQHMRPDIHEAVASMFEAALDNMPASSRDEVVRVHQSRH